MSAACTDELSTARAAVAGAGRRLLAEGLVTGTAGNVSVRVGDLIAITPSGIGYDDIEAGDVCVLDAGGRLVQGRHAPSSETPLHRAVYASTAAGAVVHHHGLHSTAVSLIHDELPAVHYYIGRLGGPPRVAPYATYGTPELAAGVRDALVDRNAALMRNHGAVAYGASLPEALDRAGLIEWLCRLYTVAAAIGTPHTLDDDQLTAVAARRRQS
ncbi:class II aldolase/adducin family protein [Pseudonocardia sp. KRD291]|uniref:class II aldolase/adducin family protein n=1 Tax=Pseudonocardia sp. KRD291 TaxID=2792007 RepID=UPI001C49DBF7|nr:class II aldolase/adducin family protein [Pseudonocardia sp. KRD291]MBW0102071.1 class II aldolase/adducin family protein [Pseudonocardia sp. KRD291]